MASTIATAGLPAAVPPFPVTRFTVDQYQGMINSGALAEDQRVELIRGWIVPKMPQGIRHRKSTTRTRIALERVLPAGWFVDEEKAIDLRAVDGMPEPDVQVVRGDRDRDFLDREPGPADLGLVVEVADTSYHDDRQIKGPDYARAGIRVYWIINLGAPCLEVYELPPGVSSAADYPPPRVFGPGDDVEVILDGTPVGRIAVHDLLPPPNPPQVAARP